MIDCIQEGPLHPALFLLCAEACGFCEPLDLLGARDGELVATVRVDQIDVLADLQAQLDLVSEVELRESSTLTSASLALLQACHTRTNVDSESLSLASIVCGLLGLWSRDS